MAAKKHKKQSRFRFGLHVYSSLLVFVAGVLLIVLWIFLSRYQQGVDAEAAAQAERERQAAYELAVSRAPQQAFEDYMASADAQQWADSWYASHPANYDDPAQVLALMEERFSDPELKYWKAEDSTESSPRYVVKSGDETIAELTLAGSGLDWSVTDVKVDLEGGEEASLLVPEGYAVFCNGIPVDSSSAEAARKKVSMMFWCPSPILPSKARSKGISLISAKRPRRPRYFFLSLVCAKPSAMKKEKMGMASLPIILGHMTPGKNMSPT